jgi:methylated-DNA-[protein]-cysteine S-methyltransferase
MAKTESNPDAVITAPFGRVGLWFHGDLLARVDLLPTGSRGKTSRRPAVQRVARELLAYLNNGEHRFNLELAEEGTPFQKSVWRQLRKIPPGKTVSYKELADRLQTSPRAIGGACRANPIPVITPCHRVIGKHGVGGFMGATAGAPLRMKEWLLEHERDRG